ncbi:MAG: hypothetical protein NC339_05410 [Muribaculaceae bacterium]|nr:hypothetical protein [Muribaculaceae bacterium]
MKKILLALAAFGVISTAMTAKVIETITMQDGTRYDGYLSMQSAKGEIYIMADTTIGFVPQAYIQRIERQPQKYEYTSTGKKVMVGNKQLCDIYYMADTPVVEVEIVEMPVDSTACVKDTLVVNSAIIPEKPSVKKVEEVLRSVEILEEGSMVKYRDTLTHVVKARMPEISIITRELRNPKQINGMNDVIITKNLQTYTGQIISTEPGRLVRINVDGRIYSVAPSEIGVLRREAIDKDEPIINQAPLVENIYLKNNEVLHGVVLVEQDYNNGTFKYADRNNLVNQRNLADIVEIGKEPNSFYAPRMEFKFEKDSVYLNREPISFMKCERKKGKLRAAVPTGAIRSVTSDHGMITLEGNDNESMRRLQLVRVSVINDEINIDLSTLNEQSIMMSTQDINPKNGILSRTFYVAPGVYAFVNSAQNAISIFRVIK